MKRLVTFALLVAGVSLSAIGVRSLAAPPADAQPENANRQRWEYKVLVRESFLVPGQKPNRPDQLSINQYGELGWELIAIESNPGNPLYSTYYFKRPKQRGGQP